MRFNEYKYCPKCHGAVFCRHNTGTDAWTVFCNKCGMSTQEYPHYNWARDAWDAMVKEIKKNE